VTTTDPGADTGSVTARLPVLDRFLPVWIGLAMVVGLALGRAVPDLHTTLERIKVDTVSLPIALGLLAMMYPVLAKVRYRHIGDEIADRRTLVLSLFLNWVAGPLLMFTLAWVFLADLPELRTGLIIVGLARCIAMVLIWNDLACGNRELAAVLVAVNSLFQIVMYSVLGWFYLTVLPGWLGLDTADLDVSMWEIAKSVLIFLGIPLLAGFLTRTIGEARKGTDWYEDVFLPRIGPVALYGLLFTIVVLFALQGDQITNNPLDVARVAVPLLVYFALMWAGSFALGYRMRFPYDRNVSVAFTAAGNNFELAIAVSIAVFGVTSGEALAGTIGPLVEVPALVGLVYVALWARRRYHPTPRPHDSADRDDVGFYRGAHPAPPRRPGVRNG
jgi:ACR3 family arsenite transporter